MLLPCFIWNIGKVLTSAYGRSSLEADTRQRPDRSQAHPHFCRWTGTQYDRRHKRQHGPTTESKRQQSDDRQAIILVLWCPERQERDDREEHRSAEGGPYAQTSGDKASRDSSQECSALEKGDCIVDNSGIERVGLAKDNGIEVWAEKTSHGISHSAVG